MDSRPPNSTLLVAFVKFDKFDHDFYTFFALILHDLALSELDLELQYFDLYFDKFSWFHHLRPGQYTYQGCSGFQTAAPQWPGLR